ncbi:MAG: AI-2E family transporter, partial [Saprospiraceae bacterium]|nr:AI-2E family transporter [Saprospiraceae bacterium]
MYINLTLKNITYFLISAIGLGWLMYIGSFLIVPLIYSLFIAILLRPLVNGIEKYVKWRFLAILVSFILVLIPFLIITGLVSVQLLAIVDGLPSIGDNLKVGLDTLQNTLNEFLPPSLILKPDQLSGQLGSILSGPISILGKGMIISSNILIGITMTVIYTFFILLYSKSLKNFVIFQYEKMYRTDVKIVLGKIQETIQQYISGMLLVIVVLSTINSIGLYLIGIEYAIFWGILAGLLAIIPYIGT